MKLVRNWLYPVGIVVSCACFSAPVFASGLFLPFLNSSDLGEAYAGSAALAEDASTDYSNPAGLMLLDHQQIILSGVGVVSRTEFEGTASNPGLGTAVNESGIATSNISGVIPALYYALPLTPKWATGFSITVPYALGNDYANDSVVRYDIVHVQQQSMDLSPVLAYQITDKLSVGAGFDALYYQANVSLATNVRPLASEDGLTVNEGSSWGYGWHGGLLYQFTPQTRVGLAYHSQIIEHLRGTSKAYTNGGVAIPSGVTVSNDLQSTIPLPPIVTLSALHAITDRWKVMGTIDYMEWSVYKQDHLINVASPVGVLNVTLPKNWNNTFRYALGTSYQLTNTWKLRTGVDYEEGATNGADREMSIPDLNRFSVYVGAHYQATKELGADMGYSHGFFKTTSVDYNDTAVSGTRLVGNAKVNTDVLGAQLVWNIT